MKRFLATVFFCLLAVIGSYPGDAFTADKQLRVVTGTTGAVYYPLGKGLADVLNKYLPNTATTRDATSGSVENIRLLVARKADIAFSQADTAWDGYKGYGTFAEPQPIRTIAVLYSNRLHMLTLQDSGIAGVRDLRGKRVASGPAGSGGEIWASRFLLANGIDPEKDLVRRPLGPTEAVAELKEKKIDAFIWPGGVPVKAITDLANAPGVKLRFFDTAQAVPAMLRRHGPVYTDGVIEANSYKGQGAAVKVAEVWNLLVVRADMDEKLVYDIVKTLFEHKAELVAAHVAAQGMDTANQPRGGSPIPFHPGAIKYFRERGVRILR